MGTCRLPLRGVQTDADVTFLRDAGDLGRAAATESVKCLLCKVSGASAELDEVLAESAFCGEWQPHSLSTAGCPAEMACDWLTTLDDLRQHLIDKTHLLAEMLFATQAGLHNEERFSFRGGVEEYDNDNLWKVPTDEWPYWRVLPQHAWDRIHEKFSSSASTAADGVHPLQQPGRLCPAAIKNCRKKAKKKCPLLVH